MAEIAGAPSPKTTESTTILDVCKKREEAGMERTRQWICLWQESLRYFLSDQLRGAKQHKDWEWVILNYLWPAIFQEMAKLSRNFKPVISPIEPSDTELAEAFQGFLSWQWTSLDGLHHESMRIEQLRAILCGKLYGYRISKLLWEGKVEWDAQNRQWLGEVRHRLWHPAQFWASDKEYINDGDCGTVRYLELDYAKSLWPDYKTQLADNSIVYSDMISAMGGETVRGQTSSSGTYPSAGTGGIDKGVGYTPGGGLLDVVLSNELFQGATGHKEDNRRFCKISEAYLKDYTEKDMKEEVPADANDLLQQGIIVPGANNRYITPTGEPFPAEMWPNETVEWREPLYPTGRYIIRNEDTILNPDEETQKYPHSVWPFVITPHYLLPFMWQGSDAVSLYRNTQDHINIAVSHLVNNMKMFGNPRVAVEQDALLIPPGRTKKRYAIMRGAGSIIRLARGGIKRFKIIDPVPPSPASVQLYQLFAQEFKNIQGLQDIAYGRKGAGEQTATEAQSLTISSHDRIKLQNIFEEEWARRVLKLTAEMDQYYYDAGRVVRVIGEDQIIGARQITEQAKAAKFDIAIEPTEGLPFDEEKSIIKHEKAYGLLSDPMPNPMLPLMLQKLGIQGWQKILARHERWTMFVQFEQLIMAVEKGEIDPEAALQMLVQQATQRLMAKPPKPNEAA